MLLPGIFHFSSWSHLCNQVIQKVGVSGASSMFSESRGGTLMFLVRLHCCGSFGVKVAKFTAYSQSYLKAFCSGRPLSLELHRN